MTWNRIPSNYIWYDIRREEESEKARNESPRPQGKRNFRQQNSRPDDAQKKTASFFWSKTCPYGDRSATAATCRATIPGPTEQQRKPNVSSAR